MKISDRIERENHISRGLIKVNEGLIVTNADIESYANKEMVMELYSMNCRLIKQNLSLEKDIKRNEKIIRLFRRIGL